MDACVGVDKEVDKVLNKFSGIIENSDAALTDLCKAVSSVRNTFDESLIDKDSTAAKILTLKEIATMVKDTVQRLTSEHRDLHSTVSKVGKAIDRNFAADFASTSREEVFSSPERVKLLNSVICQHFYRQGMVDIAEELSKESGLHSDVNKEPFQKLNTILDYLKQHDLRPALEWATKHRERLAMQNSTLEFKLHRVQFISLVEKGVGHQYEAVIYARTHLSQFVSRYESDVQNLMGALLFLPQGLQSSPYSHLLDPFVWVDLHEVFMRDACILLGLSVDSPLSVCVNAGCTALPALLNIKQVMQQRQVTGIWSGKEELPIEINLGQEHRYHSVFACPILRQQSTNNNPPVRLVCGHVISRDALNKLSNGNKLKCPYCPVEQNTSDARQVSF